ncbi:MAG: beta-propeller fold lactonase family protein [Pseudomonadota bacterium]|nr:beta-propeller fold lactonase family protein [Pseudomonadota bacterium]
MAAVSRPFNFILIFTLLVLSYTNCNKFTATVDQASFELPLESSAPPDPIPAGLPPKGQGKFFLFMALIDKDVDNLVTFVIDPQSGKLTQTSAASIAGEIVPLGIHPNRKYLYAGLSARRSVAAFLIDQANGSLTFSQEVAIGINPVYIHVDSLQKNLLIPSYSDSKVVVLPIRPDGSLSETPTDTQNTDTNSHAAISTQNSKFVYVTNTVANTISQFLLNSLTGLLTPNSPAKIQAPIGSGPRHVVHHPTKNLLYVVDELGDSVTVYSEDPTNGQLSFQNSLSTLPAGVNGNSNFCADIHITPDAKYLYASNRGDNSLAIFAIDPISGFLTSRGQQKVEGVPREFEIDPSGRYIYVAGMRTKKLTSFKIDQATGQLAMIETLDSIGDPIWVYSLWLPAQ